MMLAYYVYVIAFWTLTPLMGWLAYRRHDWALVRCALVMALGEAALSIWFGAFVPDNWQYQPAYAYAAIYLVQCVLVTVHPSNKLCSFIGGLFLSGFTVSIVHLSFAASRETDSLYWLNNLTLGWMTILVLMGGSAGEAGKHILDTFWGSLVRLARKARSSGSFG